MTRDEKNTTKKVLDPKGEGRTHRGRPRTSWLKYLNSVLKERGTNLKYVEDGGLHLNIVVKRKVLTG